MSWIKDIISPETRNWEEFYRNRFQHDRIVRSTHGVNCTGGCSWQIHVKDGIVVWETQQLDYPLLEDSLPPYEVLDAILERYVVASESVEEIIAADFDAETVRRIARLIDLNEYKRRQAAPGLKVTSKAFGVGRRIPVAQKYWG